MKQGGIKIILRDDGMVQVGAFGDVPIQTMIFGLELAKSKLFEGMKGSKGLPTLNFDERLSL